jgi:HTH-type transcriptional regulator / antitoxin HigA
MTNTIRPIRSEKDYDAALARIASLMGAEASTPEVDELDVLATLVSLYEQEHHPVDLPDPITAIRFRMEQAGLTAHDLVPVIGSRAKVSEVLSGKRQLTLHMIRALHEHLKIPADVLMYIPGGTLPENPAGIEWSRFPVTAMVKAGWFGKSTKSVRECRDAAEELMRGLIARAGGFKALPQPLYRKGATPRQNAKTDRYALTAWCFQVIATARERKLPVKYQKGSITKQWARQLAKLSAFAEGPKLATQYLEQHGIRLVHVDHLPRTYLDGAALSAGDGTPIVAVTLRFDRLDNFWFCIFHELAHVARHLHGPNDLFLDDLSLGHTGSDIEAEADQWAAEMLIPSNSWNASPIRQHPTVLNVVTLAHQLGINPAIVAGRVRNEKRNYRLLSQLVGNGVVRTHFEPSS